MCGPCFRCSSQVNLQQQLAVILRSNASATYRFLRFDGYFGAIQYAAARLRGDLPNRFSLPLSLRGGVP